MKVIQIESWFDIENLDFDLKIMPNSASMLYKYFRS